MMNFEEKKKFVRKCFKELELKNEKGFFNKDKQYGRVTYRKLPKSMRIGTTDDKTGYYWKLTESVVTEEDLKKLETKYNIILPEWYQAFLSTYSHALLEIQGKLTNPLSSYGDEEEKIVSIFIPQQPENSPLMQIEELLENYDDTLLPNGYLPIGDYKNAGPVCIDLTEGTGDDAPIVWFDHEEIFNCEEKEDYEDSNMVFFSNFEDFLKCFFLGVEFEK